jgi:hypothetical protein
MQGLFQYYSGVVLSTREVFPTGAYGTIGVPLEQRAATEEDRRLGTQAMGNPQRIIQVLKRWEGVGINEMNMVLNIGEAIPQEDVLASMRMFAKEVMPAFTKPPNGIVATATPGRSA